MKKLLIAIPLVVAAGIALMFGLQSRPADAKQVIAEQSAAWETAYPAITGSFVDAQTGEIVINVSGTKDDTVEVVAGVQQMIEDTGLTIRGVTLAQLPVSPPPTCDCTTQPKA